MRLLAICLYLCCRCFGSEDESWLEQVKTRADHSAIDWLREKIKIDMPKIDLVAFEPFTQNPCKNCCLGDVFNVEPKVYVFMSFSVPDETWLNLSSEMENYSGIFVLGGLPNNSFQEFSRKLEKLKQKGMSAAVLIDPNLFKEHQIQNSPAFVFMYGSKIHKISGNISLKCALEYTDSHLDNEYSQQVAQNE